MKCIIVDDDEMARASLEMHCQKIDDIEVLATFDQGVEALTWLRKNQPDVIFLDIEMPDLTGIELVKSVDNLPQIIFTTSHTEYAVEAFEHQVTDFLPKPVTLPRLLKAIERARELSHPAEQEIKDDKNEIFARVDGRYVRIPLQDILYIESIGDYIRVITRQKPFIIHSTLRNIQDRLGNRDFFKIHRSYIVNLTKVVDIEDTNLVVNDKVLPISRAHRPDLLKKIQAI